MPDPNQKSEVSSSLSRYKNKTSKTSKQNYTEEGTLFFSSKFILQHYCAKASSN